MERKRPWIITYEGFKGPGLRGTSLLTMIHQLELSHVPTTNCKRGWEMYSGYLLRRKEETATLCHMTNQSEC